MSRGSVLVKHLSIIFCLLLAFGCQNKEEKAAAVAKSENEILIGAVFAMTGPIASYGQESVNGIKMALDEVNKTPINGKTIKLLVEDNKGEPVESANAVRKLIDINKVDLVLGSVASSNTLASSPIAQAAKVPLLTPASTNEKVTMTGDYIFRTCFTDNFQGVVMAKFAFNTLNKRKAAIIVDNSSDYSKGLQKVFKEEFGTLGGAVIQDNFTYTQKDTDFRSLLTKVKRANPDVIFLPGYYSEVGLILKQARQMGMDMPILGGDGWDSPKLQELAGPQGIKGNYISSHFSPDDADPKVQKFVKDYMERFNEKPGAMAALGFDAMLVVADAIKRAGSNNAADIQKALATTVAFEGVTGSITIDANRNAQKSAVVLETTATGNVFNQKVSP
ncbi:MAG: ethanolamine utilization protein EutJ [Bdellovibrionales bacterium CG12_big_fil_rev_8_21_14_0_65_38_15]|nr:MAG: ethanolamine utilization protein EutJ [Bdellovibrionales bacterium CG22_combo_CG10-13_8_21_14_all_38_13]PIQ56358.1 MAG: ethanolamine utilization protein EutJ [Bdellovibrionales bacterium CG12_big_fil_rev_8_21_14_0_65_38_15]PIR29389.1 MAG: ethanolamine utilization protein EutJ [Bdellovibrionales bacterium CG11_big_fil_rev_8_21_14_0_20_38_13]